MAIRKDQFKEALRAGQNNNGDSQDPELNKRLTQRLQQSQMRQRKLLWLIAAVAGCFLIAAAVLSYTAEGTTILVEPQEAAENASVSVDGLGFHIGDYALSFSPGAVVIVASPGYETARVEVPHGKRDSLLVTLQESPALLSLKLEPPYEDAKWMLDGILVGSGANLNKEIPAGDYELKVTSLSFTPAVRRLTIGKGQSLQETLTVEPVKGRLVLNSAPSGATIHINGSDIGQTPQSVEVAGGKHEVRISLAEHSTVIDTITISSAKPTIIRDYNLSLLPGKLLFNLSPKGGLLLVNGLKTTPAMSKTVSARKEVLVTYQMPGFGKKTESVQLAPGEERTIRMDLKAETGVVEFSSIPTAQIIMNGVPMGLAPLKLSIPTVEQTFTMQAKGYESVTRKVIPKKGITTRVHVELASKKDLAMSKATQVVQNGGKGSVVGMEMALFKPEGDVFIQGAPRHEQGQRANEFQRKVKLVRPFLAGKYEVTNGQYAQFKADARGPQGQPVVNVTWMEAAAFCNWLSAQEDLPRFYVVRDGKLVGMNKQSNGYRLLTEAEWEWLARKAGRRQQTVFPWGNTDVIPEGVGNIADESAKGKTRFYVSGYDDNHAGLAAVGAFKPNQSGLHDLTGNVAEWVNDIYSWQVPKTDQIYTDPIGPKAGDRHVYKGSSWRSGTRTPLRAAYREPASQGKDDLGFRVARYVYADE